MHRSSLARRGDEILWQLSGPFFGRISTQDYQNNDERDTGVPARSAWQYMAGGSVRNAKRVSGVEPPFLPWEGSVEPINYTRVKALAGLSVYPRRLALCKQADAGRRGTRFSTLGRLH